MAALLKRGEEVEVVQMEVMVVKLVFFTYDNVYQVVKEKKVSVYNEIT